VVPYRETPIYILQTTKDSWQAQEMACETKDQAALNDLSKAVRDAVEEVHKTNPIHGLVRSDTLQIANLPHSFMESLASYIASWWWWWIVLSVVLVCL